MDRNRCPYCGSTRIGQCNKTSNFLIAQGIALTFKTLTGLRGSASNLENSFDRVYKCEDCQREWSNWENPDEIPEDLIELQKTIDDISNGVWDFSHNSQVMKFFWHVDLVINNSYGAKPSEEVKSKFHLLRAFACLMYIINNYDKIDGNDFSSLVDLDMHCRAAWREGAYCDEIETLDENVLCFIL